MAPLTIRSGDPVSGKGLFLAGSLWVAIHAQAAILHLAEFTAPLMSLAALALVIASTAWAARPLLGVQGVLSHPQAAGLGCVPVVASLVVTTTLQPAELSGYGNWWPGAVGPLLATLVYRRHAIAAVLAAAISCASMVAVVFSRFPDGERATQVAVALIVPPVTWTAAAIVVRWLLERSETRIEQFDAARHYEGLKLEATQLADRSRRDRERRLREDVVPTLTHVMRGFPDDETFQWRIRKLEAGLRDDIRGRRLIDPHVRCAVSLARKAGIDVSLADDDEHVLDDTDIELARQCVLATLRGLDRGTVSARLPADGATLLVIAIQATDSAMSRIASAVVAIAGSRTVVEAGEGDLILTIGSCQTRHTPEVPGRGMNRRIYD